jgi:hypothetical protein
MKFIKQSSIDNLIDEARIDVVIGATEELKSTISASPFTKKELLCACCKELL